MLWVIETKCFVQNESCRYAIQRKNGIAMNVSVSIKN